MTLRGFLSFFLSLEATDTSHGWSRSSNPFHIKSNPYLTSKITPNVPDFYIFLLNEARSAETRLLCTDVKLLQL